VRLSIVPQRQISDESLPVHCKIRNRLHWMLADREAERMESGSRALLLNQDGLVTETSTACFYAVIDGVIKTAARDVLKSTTRALVEELAAAESLPFSVTDFTAEDLSGATEAFISSTPCGLLPVRSVNRQAIGGSVPGPVLRQLQVAWTAMTGLDTVQQILQHNSGAA
jgi:branched-chain amino acid aminotransferase